MFGPSRRARSRKRSLADSDSTHLPGPLSLAWEGVETERTILERLERIDGLLSEDAPAGVLLEEVRALLADAEGWVRETPDAPERAEAALRRSSEALAAGDQTARSVLTTR